MDPALLRLATVLALVLVTAAVGRMIAARDGRVRVLANGGPGAAGRLAALGLADGPDGPRAVLFGSATCAPCTTVKSMLDELAADHPTFRWTYVDAAEELDLADEYGVRRVPTLMVLDADGALHARTTGVPTRDELRAALPAARESA